MIRGEREGGIVVSELDLEGIEGTEVESNGRQVRQACDSDAINDNEIMCEDRSEVEAPSGRETGPKHRKKGKRKRKRKKRKQNNLKISVINIEKKLKHEFECVERLVKKNKWDIVGVVETNQRGKNKGKKMEGYKTWVSNRNVKGKQGGGISVYTRSELNGEEWEGIELKGDYKEVEKERKWVTIKGREKWLAIAVVYMAAEGSRYTDAKWNDMIVEILITEMDILRRMGYNVVIMGDLNGHIKYEDGGVKDGMKTTNTNGRRILKMIEKGEMRMWNKEDKCIGKWTRMRGEDRSIVDYMIGDKEITKNLKKMNIDDEGKWECRSDHVWLTAEIGWEKGVSKRKIKEGRWRIRDDTEWRGFREQIGNDIDKYDNDGEMLDYERIEKIIKGAAEKHIGKARGCMSKKREEPRKIRKARKEMKKTGQKWRRGFGATKSIRRNTWREYKRNSNKVKEMIIKRETRIRTKWIEKVLKEGKQSSKSFWTKIKMMKSGDNEIKQLKDGDNKLTENPEEVKVIIQDYMRELGQETRGDDESEEEWEDEEEGDIMDEEISKKEMEEAIKAMNKGKACGLDDIPAEFIMEGGIQLAEALRSIFNGIRIGNGMPGSWKKEKGKLLHKGKCRENLDNYRGISIGSAIGKLFTKIVGNRLYRKIEKMKWLGEIQGGFREDRGTMDNIFILTQVMEEARRRNENYVVAFIDLRKAFDRVWRKGIWKVVRRLKIGKKFIKIVKDLYNGTCRRMKTGAGYTEEIPYTMGVKQGCILSPMLFALYMKGLGEILLEGGEGMEIGEVEISCLFFADDIVLIAKNIEAMKRQLIKIEKYNKEWKLETNYAKSKIMNTKGQNNGVCRVKLEGGKEVAYDETKEMKYLGVTLDSKNIFRTHKNKKIKEGREKVQETKGIAMGTDAPEMTASYIWEGEVRNKMLYGCEVITYGKGDIKELEKIQAEMGRWIVGSPRNGAYTAVRGDLEWRTMEGEIMKRKLVYWGRLMRMKDDRWAKVVMENIREHERNKWWKEVEEAKHILGVDENPRYYTAEEWKYIIKRRWMRYENRRLADEVKEKRVLRWYKPRERVEKQIELLFPLAS